MKPPAEPDAPLLRRIGGDQLDVLTRASAAGTFDSKVWAAIGGAPDRFDKLADHPMIEQVGGTSGRFRVHAEFQAMLFPRLDEGERQQVAAFAAASDDPHERALQAMIVDPDHAGDTLRAAAADALDRWDAAELASWLRTADDALARIDLARQTVLAEARRRLATAGQTRSLFWRSVVPQYHERAVTRDLWVALQAGPEWAVQLVAAGGTGKSTYLRALITRRCVPDGVPVALLDFDDAGTRTDLATDVRLVLRAAARQLDRQVVGGLTSLVAGDAPVSPQALGGALAGLPGTALVVLDTTERLLTAHRSAVVALWDALAEAHRASGGKLRVMFAGRHDLAGLQADRRPEVPGLAAKVEGQWRVVTLTGFSADEATAYLRDVRQVPAVRVPRLVGLACGAAVDGAPREANGLKLSLLADLALTGQLDEAAVDGWRQVELVYLIDRVIDRIEDQALRWMVRWAALADPLTKALFGRVLVPLVREEPAARRDRADRAHLPRQVADRDGWRPLDPGLAVPTWAALRAYVTSASWIGLAGPNGEHVALNDTIREPLRRLLAQEPVIVSEFHLRARAWFVEQLGNSDPLIARAAAPQLVYHGLRLGGLVAAADVRRFLLDRDPTAADAVEVARVVLEAEDEDVPVEPGWVDRANAELAVAAALRPEGVDVTGILDHLARISPADTALPAGLTDWLAGAADPIGARARLDAACASSDADVAVAAHRTLCGHLRRTWDPSDLDGYAAAVARAPTDARRVALAEVQRDFERFGAAIRTLGDGGPPDVRASTWLAVGRAAEIAPPASARAWVRRGQPTRGVAEGLAAGDRYGEGLARAAALELDGARRMLDPFPLDLANALLDADLDALLPEVELRVPSIASIAPAEAEVVRARLAARRGAAHDGFPAGAGPKDIIRCALAAVIAGGDPARVQALAAALAVCDLPERRLVLLDGLADARDPDCTPLVPLVESCVGDGGLDPGVQATLALVLGWGGRRDEAARMVRAALGGPLPIGAVRPWLRVHRKLELQGPPPIPTFDDEGLPPGSALPGVIWLELTEAHHQKPGDELYERARGLLADTPWRERLDRQRAAPTRGGDRVASVDLRRTKTGWRVQIGLGSHGFDANIDDEPLPPLDDRDLGYRLATNPAEVVEALSRVSASILRDDNPEAIALTVADGAWLPWELARWPAFLHRAASPAPPAPPSPPGRRVLWVNAGYGSPESDPVPRAYRERGFDVQVLSEVHPSALAEVYAGFRPDLVHLTGTFTAIQARAALVAKEPIHGDTVGRLLAAAERPATLVVDPTTASLSDPERWTQLVLRNAWCSEAAVTLPRVLGVGCVPDPLRPVHDRAMLDGLTAPSTVRALVDHVRIAAPDLTFRAVAAWISEPDRPLALGSQP